MKTEFYSKTIEESLRELKTDAISGLGLDEAKARLEQNGPNRLQGAKPKSIIITILAQFKDFLVVILLIAAAVSIFTGYDLADGIIIIAIVVINMIIGISQEKRADNALKELRDMSGPKAKVKRGGVMEKIESDTLVVGDIVVLDAGDYIPADIRIIESINLKIDESTLTGESKSVNKRAEAVLDTDTLLGDRVNQAYMGTIVTYGRGLGVVAATGMDTEMGKIAAILNEADDEPTPLQIKLNKMAKVLGITFVAICAAVFLIGFLQGREVMDMVMMSISLAVAAVPEGIAIVVTIILAIGVQKMVKSNVIVKQLRAVETLGSTTVICSDKTGTLTQNKMTVVKVFDTGTSYEVTGTGYSAAGEVTGALSKNIALMAQIAVLCNDAVYDVEQGRIIGDPTEGAMLVLGEKVGVSRDVLSAKYTRVQEIPFDSERKLMSTYNLIDGKVIMNTKGAPDVIISRASKVYQNGELVPMTDKLRGQLLAQNDEFAAQALRVLGFAYKEYDSESAIDNIEDELTYVGMMCMIDPPRDEVAEAVENCRRAGINVKMITGDHKTTAMEIAKTLGIMQPGGKALDGAELSKMTDEELCKEVSDVNVFARVSPEHKVRIVSAIKENGNIVAMTGDGVNDAPSLKKADIGIAMGITGTDVSKEASDMILVDDNFVSIVNAVEQGRTIYNNIRKVAGYLLACNIGEILIILIAIIVGLPAPLVATQLLFVNLLTDAFPAFALGMEGKENGTMNKKPRDPKEPILNKNMNRAIAFKSILLCVGTLGAFLYGYLVIGDYATAMTLCFATLVLSELIMSYPSRKGEYLGVNKALFVNKFLNRSMLASILILAATIYIPALNYMFTTVPLSATNVGMVMLFSAIPVLGSEFSKRIFVQGA